MKTSPKKYRSVTELKRLRTRIRQLVETGIKIEREAGHLRKTEEQWHTLLRSVPDIVIMADRSGKILYINRTVPGFSIEKTINRTIYEFVPPEHHALTHKAIRRVFRTGQEVSFETQAAGPGGAPVWYSTRLGPVEHGGKVVAVAQVSTDITQQKQANQALRESEEKYRTLLEGSAEGVLAADLKTKRFTYANPAICRMLGYSVKELERLTVTAIHPRKDLKYVMDEFKAQARGEKILANYIPCLCKNGKVIYANVSSRQVLFEGRPCLVGFFSDVTKQKEAGEKLKQRNRELITLNAIAKAVGESLDLKKILRATLKESFSILGAKAGAIYLLDSSTGIFSPFVHYGYSQMMLEEVAGFRAGEGLSGHVAKTKKPLVVANLASDSRNISPDAVRKGWRSYAGVPILSKGNIMGVMILIARQEGYLTEEHVDLLQRIGDQIGFAIENAELYRQVREELQQRRNIENGLQIRTREMGERVKELNCLYGLSKLMETPGISMEEILKGAVRLLPAAMRYPEVTTARLAVDGRKYQAGGRSGKLWKLSSDLMVHGEQVGVIEVFYQRKVWSKGEEPFLQEERELLGAIAERLGHIIERKRVELVLKENEERYRDLFENANDLIQIVTMEERFLYVNKAWRKTLGYNQREIDELSLSDVIHPDYRQHCLEVFQRILFGEAVDKIETAFLTKDGRKVILEGSASCRYKDGKPYATHGIFRDITDRQRMEESLRIEKAHLESLFENAQEAIVMTNNEGIILRINQEFTRMFGYTEYEAVGHPVDDLVAPRQFHDEAKKITWQVTHQENISVEAVRWRKDGTPVYVSILGAPVVVDGTQVGVYGIYRDISARKQAEQALRESEEKLRVMSAAAQDAIVMIDEDGHISYWNAAAEKMFGYASQEIMGKNLHLTLAPKRFHLAYKKGFARFQKTGNGVAVGKTLELAALRKDGSEIPVELSLSAVKAKDKWNAIGIMRDISERKRMESILRDSEGQFQSLLGSIEDVAWAAAADGSKYYYMNDATEQVYGHPREDFYKDPNLWRELIYPDDGARALEDAEKLMKEGRSESEYRIVRPDGQIRWISDRKYVVRDEAGEPIRIGGLATDITDRKRAEQALSESRQKIEGLHKTARMLEECQNEEQVYHITVRAAEGILSFKMCTLDIAVGKKLVVKATSAGMPRGASTESSLSEKSLAAKTYRTGKTTLFGHIDEVPDARPTRKNFQSGISAPLGKIGVFQAVASEPDAFSEEDVKLLELLLEHAVEAVNRIRLENRLRDQAIRDPLTGAFNRRYFRESIERELPRAHRSGQTIGFLLIDVDGFKEINDTHGHQTGDRVLRQVVEFLRQHIRSSEMVVRYGGDEFLVVMPEMKTSPDVVKRRLVKALQVWNRNGKRFDVPIDLSIGSAAWQPESDLSVDETLTRADEQMYQEKRKKKASLAARL